MAQSDIFLIIGGLVFLILLYQYFYLLLSVITIEMFTFEKPTEGSFVYTLFGIQQLGDHQSAATKSLIESFDRLFKHTSCYLDRVTQDGIYLPGNDQGKTLVWIATWKTVAEFQAWWTSKDVTTFWASLPSDAGMWREFLTIPYSRSQYKSTQDRTVGLGAHYRHIPATKNGYWGWIRDSIDDVSKTNRFDSLLRPPPAPKRESVPATVVEGRVHMTSFPDNICFNLERQDLSQMTEEETKLWIDEFDEPVRKWMDDLAFALPEDGILSSRMCYDEKMGTYRSSKTVYHNYNMKVEPFYFIDLRAMERLGRSNKGHVEMRNRVLKTYGPGGSMFGVGRMALWVETSILKANEIEAEYVGCVEGTGFMAFRHHEAFQN